MAEQVPREAKLASLLLSTSGVAECEPKVVQQLLEFIYRYVTDVLQEGLVYSEHAGKTELDLEDLRLAIKSQLRNMFVQPPARDYLLELAARKNSQPLPIFDENAGLRLPPDQHTLLGASYRITSQRRPVKTIPAAHPLAQYASPEADAASSMRAMGMAQEDPAMASARTTAPQKRKHDK